MKKADDSLSFDKKSTAMNDAVVRIEIDRMISNMRYE